ncbi:esterase family protein [Ectobacillus sp. JY-23]|uniref:alpha/beta hydrolase n=1 Tax=Ectobacillus sp. JY-23 TaxID=2933872 RepID=UPI001FF556B5|nr:esterase family protein [Ectobacillus sp. JY-23]UOY94592.1 esterase family protein [Ectobacillus sp. JY-23]
MTMTKGTLQEITFFSEALQEDMTLLIYLPSGYTPLLKHTVVIAQDGSDYIKFGRAPRVLEALLEEGEIDRTIFVGIPYKDVHDRKEKYHPSGAQNAAYIRFLAHELVPFLDREYPTYQVGNGRVLAGDSLGGTVSFMTALMYPHTFGKVIMQSPFVDEAVIKQAQQALASGIEVYHIIGTEETAVKTTDGQIRDFLAPNRELHSVLKPLGTAYYYEEFQGDHTWKHWQKNLPHAFNHTLAQK